MARVLVLFAHPAQRPTSINLSMARRAEQVAGVTFVDIYAEYPRFDIDVEREQKRLIEHDVIVFQFPLFWYSTPALLKQWQDLVLEYGFAHGPHGKKLAGKLAIACITTAGSVQDYSYHGGNRHPFSAFILPLRQTVELCGMTFLPPFVLHAANHTDSHSARTHIESYPLLLAALRDATLDVGELGRRDQVTAADLAALVDQQGVD
ncbi:NAD(P)H-dependent oxidoreductase [Rhizobium sp. 11515TR]|uniref:NAD(P)H-dependent oxidoreductase n=1 Tax=Rhizobium sp. 11515TR TaxID=2028343 RepID=UPI000BA88BAE|nr:NAD(P)H-dependent oxidoreductase [Rhizobium sp. 11515TR]ASW08528.1 potassium transporter KefG [Rhizobium sp. 11515TR]